MKISNDLTCRPVKGGHIYEYRERNGWMSVISYELGHGVYINQVKADLDELVNRNNVDQMNLFGIPIFIRGSGRISMDDNISYTFRPGDALFGIPNNKRLHLTVNSRVYENINIVFSPDTDVPSIGDDPPIREIISTLRERLGMGMCTPFHLPVEMRVLAESVFMELEANQIRNVDLLIKRALQVFHILYRITEPDWTDVVEVSDSAAVDRICQRLIGDFTVPKRIKDICEEEGVNEFWFIHNFKKRYGMNPKEYIVYSKHIRAAALLLTGNYKVSEVVGMVGYSSRSKFTVAFRETHGCNPMQYVNDFDRIVEEFHEHRLPNADVGHPSGSD